MHLSLPLFFFWPCISLLLGGVRNPDRQYHSGIPPGNDTVRGQTGIRIKRADLAKNFEIHRETGLDKEILHETQIPQSKGERGYKSPDKVPMKSSLAENHSD